MPLLIIDDLGMRKLPHTAAEDLLELIMRRYERASTMLTSNRPVDDWGKLLGDTAAVTALLDRLLHHAHILKCGPRSWRTRVQTTLLAGAKDDPRDARVLASALRTDPHCLERQAPTDPAIVELREWSRVFLSHDCRFRWCRPMNPTITRLSSSSRTNPIRMVCRGSRLVPLPMWAPRYQFFPSASVSYHSRYFAIDSSRWLVL